MTRTCRVCQTEKPLEDFPRAVHGKDGRRNQCRECRNAYHKSNSKKWYEANRTEKLAKVKAYAELNRDKVAADKKAYRSQEHRMESERERMKLRRQDPAYKRYFANYMRLRLIRERTAPGVVTKQQLQARWDYYGGRCWLCDNEATEMDHVIPLTKGGTNWPANLRPICRPCNARKSNIWPYPIKLT